MNKQIERPSLEKYQYLRKREMSKLIGLSGDWLKKSRREGLLIENIHWIRMNSKLIIYCVPLVMDCIQNQGDPIAHQRAIENYQANFLSNQKRVRSSSYTRNK